MERTRHLRPNRGKNPNARWIVEEPITKRPAKKRRSSSTASSRSRKAVKPEPEVYEGETRCKCNGEVPDDKTMAECERCSTWQHIVCEFGVDDESALPDDNYLCSQCRPADSAKEEDAVKSESDVEKDAQSNTENGNEKNLQLDANPFNSIKDKVRRSVAEAWLKILENINKNRNTGYSYETIVTKSIDLEKALFTGYCDEAKHNVTQAYREQFRTLLFNLKDDKNHQLQLSVLNGTLDSHRFVKMSSEQLRNPELQQMTEDIRKENIRESIITEEEPPKEKIVQRNAEIIEEPTDTKLEDDQKENELECEKAMEEPLGPPPPSLPSPHESTPSTDSKPEIYESEKSSPEDPIWEGPVRLADDSIVFSAKGMYLPHSKPSISRSEWEQYTNNELVVQGLVSINQASTYFRASLLEPEHHVLGAFSIATQEHAKSTELYDYMSKLGRIGSLKTSDSKVKDAFLVPLNKEFDLSILPLTDTALQFIEHLKAEHDAGKVLIAVYVTNKD